VRRRLLDDPAPTYERYHLFMMREYADRKGAARFGEKTPSNVWYLTDLRRIYPDARIIEIVRDPRAVVASALKVPFTSDDVLTNAIKWKCDIRFGLAFARGDDGYRRVRYEQLVQDPETELTRLCDFLGEAFSPSMLEYHRSAAELIHDEPWKERATHPVVPEAAERWRQELTRAQVRVIELVTGPECRYLGYPLATVRPERYLGGLAQVPTELWRYYRFKGRFAQAPDAGLLRATNARRAEMLKDIMRRRRPFAQHACASD